MRRRFPWKKLPQLRRAAIGGGTWGVAVFYIRSSDSSVYFFFFTNNVSLEQKQSQKDQINRKWERTGVTLFVVVGLVQPFGRRGRDAERGNRIVNEERGGG